MIQYKEFERLKPLALELLYSFEDIKLPYYTETNKTADIIKLLIRNNYENKNSETKSTSKNYG